LTRNVIDDDCAFTELVEIEPADEDVETLLAVAMFCVIVIASMASLLLAIRPPISTPGGGDAVSPMASLGPKGPPQLAHFNDRSFLDLS